MSTTVSTLLVNRDRLMRSIADVATIGKLSNGGVQRMAFSEEDCRASYDAQEIAQITDMGMIFVPSQSGISHAVTEYTHPNDCVQGANVLLRTLLNLNQHYRCS